MTSQPNDTHWQRQGEVLEPNPARPAAARLVDPEDDLTPIGYPDTFGPSTGTTTVIPYSDAAAVGAPGAGYNLLDQHERALPYAQPQSVARRAAEPAGIDADDDHGLVPAVGRRGTQHLGLLVLRAGLGVVLAAHGLQKMFGWWGGQGVTAFKNSLSDVGYQHADILAYVGSGGEIAGGVLLIIG
ncbi:DoxX family protein, partial [Mycobacterium sp.]|uniref:DoxX family protein n=1 Tax=Mycobacterium sp. TaxID=1785 RepID=UPI003C70FBFC